MTHEIEVTARFSAAHALRLHDGSAEPVHGHNWRVELAVRAPRLDAIGVVMDFHDLQARLNEILAPLHHRHLNDLPMFQQANPTAENVAAHVAGAIRLPAGVSLASVRVWETDDCAAVVRFDLVSGSP